MLFVVALALGALFFFGGVLATAHGATMPSRMPEVPHFILWGVLCALIGGLVMVGAAQHLLS